MQCFNAELAEVWMASVTRHGVPGLLTVGVPAWNARQSISASLKSILASSFTNLEVIVSDNASTDGTAAVAEAIAAEDVRVRVLKQPTNIGAARNFAQLLEMASGEFFAWVAADDSVETDYLGDCVHALQQDDQAALAFGNVLMRFSSDESTVVTYKASRLFESSSRAKRFLATVRRFPSAHFYGVYRTTALRSNDGLRGDVAADTLLVRRLSLGHTLLGVSTSAYRYALSPKWKSPSEYAESHGDLPRRRLRRPALYVFRDTVRDVWTTEMGAIERFQLVSSVTALEIWRVMGVVIAFMLGRIPRIRKSQSWALHVYRLIYGLDNVEIGNPDQFLRRVVLPTLRWRSSTEI